MTTDLGAPCSRMRYLFFSRTHSTVLALPNLLSPLRSPLIHTMYHDRLHVPPVGSLLPLSYSFIPPPLINRLPPRLPVSFSYRAESKWRSTSDKGTTANSLLSPAPLVAVVNAWKHVAYYLHRSVFFPEKAFSISTNVGNKPAGSGPSSVNRYRKVRRMRGSRKWIVWLLFWGVGGELEGRVGREVHVAWSKNQHQAQ